MNVASEDENEIPEEFNLYQNYPNPFNPVTTIEYSLPVSNKVLLKIYDILGREVSTLKNEIQPAGHYVINFDGTNLTSGIYFYRLECDKKYYYKKNGMLINKEISTRSIVKNQFNICNVKNAGDIKDRSIIITTSSSRHIQTVA